MVFDPEIVVLISQRDEAKKFRLSDMKVLVTGANGLLGVRLARRLADMNHEVLALVRRPGENPDLQYKGIQQVQGDVRDAASLHRAMVGVQQLYHLAALSTDWAPDRRDFYRINAVGTVNVLNAARDAGVEKIVNTSSAGSIGPPDQADIKPVDENHIRTVGFFIDYESSKAIADDWVLRYVLQGMNIVTANPTRIFGPGPLERKNGYLVLIHRFLKKKVVAYPALKTQVANFVHVDDVVEGLLLAMANGKSGERYLLGGSDVTFPDLFRVLKKVTGHSTWILPIPLWLLGAMAKIANLISRLSGKPPMLTRSWLRKASYSWPVSSERAKRELGYAPMDYETAILKTVEWVRAEQKAGRLP